MNFKLKYMFLCVVLSLSSSILFPGLQDTLSSISGFNLPDYALFLWKDRFNLQKVKSAVELKIVECFICQQQQNCYI